MARSDSLYMFVPSRSSVRSSPRFGTGGSRASLRPSQQWRHWACHCEPLCLVPPFVRNAHWSYVMCLSARSCKVETLSKVLGPGQRGLGCSAKSSIHTILAEQNTECAIFNGKGNMQMLRAPVFLGWWGQRADSRGAQLSSWGDSCTRSGSSLFGLARSRVPFSFLHRAASSSKDQ